MHIGAGMREDAALTLSTVGTMSHQSPATQSRDHTGVSPHGTEQGEAAAGPGEGFFQERRLRKVTLNHRTQSSNSLPSFSGPGENAPMERFQKFVLLPFILATSFTALGFCYSILDGPANATVLAGSEARFNCTVANGWTILIWLLNTNPVLTVINSHGPIETSDRFTSHSYNNSQSFTSELIVHNTQLNDSGKIECSIQKIDGSSFAFLSVQVNGSLLMKNSTLIVKENTTVEVVCEALGWAPAPEITWMTNDSLIDKSRYVTQQSQGSNSLHNALSVLTLTPMNTEILTCLADIEALPNPQNATIAVIVGNSTLDGSYSEDSTSTWVIALAVVFSIVGFILLIILIWVVVRCCCLKKGSTYENEVRKISIKKKTDEHLGNRQRSGSKNQGYVPEEPHYTGQIPTVVSLPPMSTKFTVPHPDLHTSSAPKGRPQRHTDYPVNPKKIRNVTHV